MINMSTQYNDVIIMMRNYGNVIDYNVTVGA